jgi:hypothetical protein
MKSETALLLTDKLLCGEVLYQSVPNLNLLFFPFSDQRWGPSNHLTRGVKRPGRGVEHPSPSSAEVKERVELHLYSPLWALMACSKVKCTFTVASSSERKRQLILRVPFALQLNIHPSTYTLCAHRHQPTASLSTPASNQWMQRSVFPLIDRAGQGIDNAADWIQCECLAVGYPHRRFAWSFAVCRQISHRCNVADKTRAPVFRQNIQECANISIVFLWGANDLSDGEDGVVTGIQYFIILFY